MDTFSVDKSFYEDLTELWDSDMEPIQVMQDVLRVGGDVSGDVVVSECWGSGGAGTHLLDTKPTVVLHDRLMTDAALGAVPIKTEHSYSLASDGDSMPESPISLETMDDDMDEEILMAIPMNRATQHRGRGRPESPSNNLLDIKQEPLSSPSSPSSDEDASSAISVGGNESPIYMPDHTIVKHEPQTMARTQMSDAFSGEIEVLNSQQSLLKQPTIFLATRNNVFSNQQGRMVIPKLNIKVESNGSGFSLPPTPPSSTTSDSEGNVSPMHASPPSPLTAGGVRTLTARQSGTRLYLSSSSSSSHCRQPIQTPLISTQPKGSTGSLFLTEEEKRTLLAEGYPIPTRLPLTKAEEKSLKKIRRKIKNKISAQESRRKKKEYMDALEKRVENLVSENCDYKKKIESLEGSNSSLLSQLHKLQQMLGQTPSPAPSSSSSSGRSRTSASSSSSHHFTRNSLK